MDKKKFGNFIKNSRLKKTFTQKELADILYIDVTAVSKWERGITYPDITLIPDICKALDINEHELIESSTDTEYRKMKSEANRYRKIKNTIFYVSSLCYIIAILTCFIVNLAVDHKLSWFFIVFTSCLCGFTFIPTITRFFNKYKLIIFILSTLLSMFLLFLTCSIYTRNYWFMIATMSVVLEYFLLFFPILFYIQRRYLKEQTFDKLKKFFILIYAIVLLILTCLLIIVINNYYQINIYNSIYITTYSFSILIIIGIIRLLLNKMHITTRIGVDLLLSIGYFYGLSYVLTYLIVGSKPIYTIDFKEWNTYSNGNTLFIVTVILCVVGVLLIILSIFNNRKK